jgi:phosphoribosylformimino-5-aminoimidazole carboxamide ribotide isomerase
MRKLTILPAIDLRGGKCVRLIKGDYNREIVYSDNPVEQALEWESSGAEYIHIVDLDGAKGGSVENFQAIREITGTVKIPCELGGGIRSIGTAEKILDAGISRVILGTAACKNRELVVEMLEKFGPEKVVVGIDAKDGKAAVGGWLEDSGIDALELAEYFAGKGVVRFIYTDISTDGMLSGPNLDAQSELCDRVPGCKVIASGGIAEPDDVRKLLELNRDNLEGVIIGKALYDKRASLSDFIRAGILEG